MVKYEEFLASKQHIPPPCGFEVDRSSMNQHMFEWQKDITRWALRKGRAALFEECGNGKTIQQLEFADQVARREGKPVLIVAPLTVGAQTLREAQKFGYFAAICRTQADVMPGIGSTGYQSILMGRRHIGVEMKASYFRLAAENCAKAERTAEFGSQATDGISLFDMMGETT